MSGPAGTSTRRTPAGCPGYQPPISWNMFSGPIGFFPLGILGGDPPGHIWIGP